MKRIPREIIKELIESEEFKSTGDIMTAIKAMFSDVLAEVLEDEGKLSQRSEPAKDAILGITEYQQEMDGAISQLGLGVSLPEHPMGGAGWMNSFPDA